MTEERIVEHHSADGNTHTTTTVIRDSEVARSGSRTWLFLLVLIGLAIAGYVAFSQLGQAEMAKDGAIADAASDVGNAAQKVGDAAQDVADNIGN